MITGIMLGILVFQLFLFMSFCSVHNMNDKLFKLVNENQKLHLEYADNLNENNKKQLEIIQKFFTAVDEKIKIQNIPRLPGDEWKDLGEDSNE